MYFFFNDTATTEIYTLSLHDALPIFVDQHHEVPWSGLEALDVLDEEQRLEQADRELVVEVALGHVDRALRRGRSEEHTSELQSRQYLVCRLLLEKQKDKLDLDLRPTD